MPDIKLLTAKAYTILKWISPGISDDIMDDFMTVGHVLHSTADGKRLVASR